MEGSRTPKVNGLYNYAGTNDDYPKYKKSATYKGEEAEFLLFCYLYGEVNNRKWHISIVPAGYDPGDSDIVFYYSAGTEDEMTPPRDGWQSIEREQLPAPKVHVQSSHDSQNDAMK